MQADLSAKRHSAREDIGLYPTEAQHLATKDQASKVGLKSDATLRVVKVRKDDAAHRRKIKMARKVIYKGYTVDSTALDHWLKAESLVAAQVSEDLIFSRTTI